MGPLLPNDPELWSEDTASAMVVATFTVFDTEEVSSSVSKTVKVATTIALAVSSLHSSGSLGNNGPIPPKADQTTTYSIVLNVHGGGSAVAGGAVTTILPGYVSYTDVTTGAGTFSY